MISNEVRAKIIEDIKRRKYFSIMFDATPDVSKQDQLSQIIRSVECSSDGCVVHENFIDFVSTVSKTGKDLANVILEKLVADNLDFMDCRGQGYDNGANMSGRSKGVQARLQEVNPAATFVPCAAHSPNHVGMNAAEKVKPAKLLLGEVQNLFTVFAGSTSRWKLLKEKCHIELKCQSATRWSSSANAVLSLWNQLGSVIEVLTEMCESDELSSDVLSTAHGRLRAIESFRLIMGLCVWKNLLGQIDKCNEILQIKGCDLHSASKRLHALVDWLTEFHETGFDECMHESKELADVLQIDTSIGFEDTRR